MVRRLVGGDDVELPVLEVQAGRIRGEEEYALTRTANP
jgi:hypothetical protein